jgi:murein DD-endopeptidase MepM/ murein hydrolase activator NlpD
MQPRSREQLRARRARKRVAQQQRQRRTLMLLTLIPALVLAAAAFPFVGIGDDSGASAALPMRDSASAITPPADVTVARSDGIALRLPVELERVTAFVFRPVDNPTAQELEPGTGIDHHEVSLDGSTGPARGGLDVGAPAGTPVYAPVDGVIANVSDFIVAGRKEGYELTIEPVRASSVGVRITHLDPYDGRTVPDIGQQVSAGATILGRVRDLSGTTQLLAAQFTSDAGNNVHIEVLANPNPPGT